MSEYYFSMKMTFRKVIILLKISQCKYGNHYFKNNFAFKPNEAYRPCFIRLTFTINTGR